MRLAFFLAAAYKDDSLNMLFFECSRHAKFAVCKTICEQRFGFFLSSQPRLYTALSTRRHLHTRINALRAIKV